MIESGIIRILKRRVSTDAGLRTCSFLMIPQKARIDFRKANV